MSNLPPAPAGWKKTIADLMAEVDSGARQSVGSPEIDWARDYERSLLPPDTRFPCEGEIYESLEDLDSAYLTSWMTPFTGGGTAALLRGERIIIRYVPADSRPIVVYADAVDYKSLEARVVPAGERRNGSYQGFHFAIRTADLNRKFRLVNE